MTDPQLSAEPAPTVPEEPWPDLGPDLTEEQFAALSRCAEWQRMYGDRANWTKPPLDGIALELCDRGYLIADDLAGVLVGLSVTKEGMRKVAH